MSATPQSPPGRPPLNSNEPKAGNGISPLRLFGAASVQSWLFPGENVLLMEAGGGRSVWRNDRRQPAAAKASRFVAVLLPDELALRRTVLLPRMSALDTAQALLLEARNSSPFPAAELVWGSRVRDVENGQRRADLVIASRRHVAEFLHSHWPEAASGAKQPEVWALSERAEPVVILGFGEGLRLGASASQRRWNWALSGVALVLGALVAVTPTIQLRQRALEAVQAYDAVARKVAPLVRKRDELTGLDDRIRALGVASAGRVDFAATIEYLTRVLPDDTYLYNLDVQATKITAYGLTSDAAALFQRLSSDPRLKNLRSPAAVTRQPGSTKESFVIEFTLEPAPAVLAAIAPTPLAPTPVTGTVAAVAGSPAAPAVAPGAPAPATAAPVRAPATAAPSAGSSPFVIGGSK